VTVLAIPTIPSRPSASVLESLCSRQVDGLLLATALLNDEIVAECQERQVPFVLVNRTVTEAAVTSVVTNDSYGIRLVMEHLVTLGHRKIAYVGVRSPLRPASLARRIIQAMSAYRLKADTDHARMQVLTTQAGESACQTLIRATALHCDRV